MISTVVMEFAKMKSAILMNNATVMISASSTKITQNVVTTDVFLKHSTADNVRVTLSVELQVRCAVKISTTNVCTWKIAKADTIAKTLPISAQLMNLIAVLMLMEITTVQERTAMHVILLQDKIAVISV